MPGGPAMKSKKISVGDRIISIGQGTDGAMQNVIGWRLDDIVDSIRGDEGTIVKLEVETESETKVIELKRGKVTLEESDASKEVINININGAQRWNRTTDTRIFSPLLYQLSYLGKLDQRIICKNEDNVINQSNDLKPSAFA